MSLKCRARLAHQELAAFNASSRSITLWSSLIRIVVRCGWPSVGTECAVTRAGCIGQGGKERGCEGGEERRSEEEVRTSVLLSNAPNDPLLRASQTPSQQRGETLTNPSPSSAASTIPAVIASVLNWFISRGTLIEREKTGVFVEIISVCSGRQRHGVSVHSQWPGYRARLLSGGPLLKAPLFRLFSETHIHRTFPCFSRGCRPVSQTQPSTDVCAQRATREEVSFRAAVVSSLIPIGA